MRLGGVILCGGRSTRMGASKALLPFGDATMLENVACRLAMAVENIVVVAARDQKLPNLPASCVVARDQRENVGPLEGLRVGLATLAGHCDAAFVTSCDAPMLRPALAPFLANRMGAHSAAAPFAHGRLHPLSAVYRVELLATAEKLLNEGEFRLTSLLDRVSAVHVAAEEMITVDPAMESLRNVNTPQEYTELQHYRINFCTKY